MSNLLTELLDRQTVEKQYENLFLSITVEAMFFDSMIDDKAKLISTPSLEVSQKIASKFKNNFEFSHLDDEEKNKLLVSIAVSLRNQLYDLKFNGISNYSHIDKLATYLCEKTCKVDYYKIKTRVAMTIIDNLLLAMEELNREILEGKENLQKLAKSLGEKK